MSLPQFIGWDILVVALLGGSWFLAWLAYEAWEKIHKHHNHLGPKYEVTSGERDDDSHPPKNLTIVKE